MSSERPDAPTRTGGRRPPRACHRVRPGCTLPSKSEPLPVTRPRCAVAMGYLPFASLATVHLRGPQAVAARLTVDGGRSVLKAGGVGQVAHHVIRLQVEHVRRAV